MNDSKVAADPAKVTFFNERVIKNPGRTVDSRSQQPQNRVVITGNVVVTNVTADHTNIAGIQIGNQQKANGWVESIHPEHCAVLVGMPDWASVFETDDQIEADFQQYVATNPNPSYRDCLMWFFEHAEPLEVTPQDMRDYLIAVICKS